ncbi:MAG: hypothetical protein IMW95_02675 [Moorella humiferrea]|nr:hypothetical protein [Moorella humiferrea]
MPAGSRQRFLMALNHQVPDRIPIFDFLNNPALFEEVIGVTPQYYYAENAVPCAYKLGLDAVWIPMGGFPALDPPGSLEEFTDEWGVTYRRDGFSWPGSGPVGYPIKDKNDLANYQWPDPKEEWRYQEARTAVRLAREKDMAVIAGIRGAFSTANLLMDMQNLFISFYDQPEVVREIFQKTTDFFIEAGRRLVEAGVDALIVHEDLGFATNTLISPDLYQQYLLPYHQELFSSLSATGVPVVLHSDGNIKKFMDWLVTLKINGLHPLQRSAQMNLAEAKKNWGEKLCLIGNVDAGQTLAHGTPEEIETEVKECVETAAPGGGYILASDHSLNMGIPVANALKFLEIAHRYSREAYK